MEAQPINFMLWIDKQVLQSFNVKKYPALRFILKPAANAFIVLAVFYLLPAYLALSQHNMEIIEVLTGQVIISQLVGIILKATIKRPRPLNKITFLGKIDSSFPSGHTMLAIGLALINATFFPNLSIILLFLAVLVGLGRMYLQMHYLTDVLAGACIGGIVAGLIVHFI